MERVRRRGNEAPERLFASIAMDADRSSFEAFQKALSFLSDRIALGRAYRHIEAFADNEELTPDVLDYLVERALRADSLPARELSIDPLKYFGERAFGSYRRIVDRSRDASCRSIAIYPLLPGLCAEGSERRCG